MESSTSESTPAVSSEISYSSSPNSINKLDVNCEYEVRSEDKLKNRELDIQHVKYVIMNEINSDSYVDQAKLPQHKFVNLKIPQKVDNKNENAEENEVGQKNINSTKIKDERLLVTRANDNNQIAIGEINKNLEVGKKDNLTNIPLSMISSKGSNFKGILRLKKDSVTGKLTLIQHNPSEEELKKITEKFKGGSSVSPEIKVQRENQLRNVNIDSEILQTKPLSKLTYLSNSITEFEGKSSEIEPKLHYVEIDNAENKSNGTTISSEIKESSLVNTECSEPIMISENRSQKGPYCTPILDKSTNSVHDFEKVNYNTNINYPPPKRKRGRPRKHINVESEKNEVQTSCSSNYQDLKVQEKHNIHKKEVYKDTTKDIEIPREVNSAVDNIDQEHFEPVKDFVAARARVRDIYKRWRKKYEVIDGKPKIPAYKLAAAKQAKRQVLIRQTQKHSVFRTWDSVLGCKDRVEEEHRTKFLQTSQTKDHKMDRPLPGKNVLFQLTRTKGVSATVPYNGIPFMWIGHITYRCHLSGDRPSAKKRKDMLTFSGERQRKFTNSKKLGCPAVFTVTKVARFPDFEVSDESHCATTVGAQLRESWANHPEKCRFYLEYHVRRPSLEDHQFHDQAQSVVGFGKFQEPVDSRILKRIHELTYDGVIGAKPMREYINDFVYNTLFKDQEAPDPARRRYNPTNTDIRNAMKKARLQMRLAGISAIQVACKGVMRELSSVINNTSNEEYLSNLRDHLAHLTSTVKEGHSLQPFLQVHPPKAESPNKIVPGSKRLKVKKDAEGLEAPQTVQAIVQYPTQIPTQAETDQATQILYHYNDQNDQQQCENQYEETVTEVYYYPNEGYVEHVQQVQTHL
ncbi:unnamed protein product [Meganyctiphanes norvegica]|uniref:Uncharacterized protein n=1 Tax=Meganyctiphanes norvegica TaxID=48144 RepID=A0AAV2QE43_MEGNR